MGKNEQTNWIDDAFDDEKNAQLEEELQRARAKSRVTVIVLLVIIAVLVLIGAFMCSAASLMADGLAL